MFMVGFLIGFIIGALMVIAFIQHYLSKNNISIKLKEEKENV